MSCLIWILGYFYYFTKVKVCFSSTSANHKPNSWRPQFTLNLDIYLVFNLLLCRSHPSKNCSFLWSHSPPWVKSPLWVCINSLSVSQTFSLKCFFLAGGEVANAFRLSLYIQTVLFRKSMVSKKNCLVLIFSDLENPSIFHQKKPGKAGNGQSDDMSWFL